MVDKIEDSYPDGTCAADYADSLPKEVRRLIREKKKEKQDNYTAIICKYRGDENNEEQ